MELQEQIRTLIKSKGISPYKISKDLNISEAQLSKFFNYKVNLSLGKLINIVEYLECEILIVPKKDA